MGILSKIRGWLKRPPQKQARPRVGPGHRGVAAGNLSRPDLEAYAERLAQGHEEVPASEVEDFLAGGYPLIVNSTNVSNVTYFPQEGKLLVQFLNGGKYMYSSISEQEALSFANAQSKGGWVWSYLRVRGSRTAHRKPFTKIG